MVRPTDALLQEEAPRALVQTSISSWLARRLASPVCNNPSLTSPARRQGVAQSPDQLAPALLTCTPLTVLRPPSRHPSGPPPARPVPGARLLQTTLYGSPVAYNDSDVFGHPLPDVKHLSPDASIFTFQNVGPQPTTFLMASGSPLGSK